MKKEKVSPEGCENLIGWIEFCLKDGLTVRELATGILAIMTQEIWTATEQERERWLKRMNNPCLQ